jgi:hypothetical protein
VSRLRSLVVHTSRLIVALKLAQDCFRQMSIRLLLHALMGALLFRFVSPFATVAERMRIQMSNKRNLVLYMDDDLVKKSKELGFNLSKTFENHLKHLINNFSTVYTQKSLNSEISRSPEYTAC